MTVLNQMFVGVGQLGFSDEHYVDVNDHDHEESVVMQYTGLKDKNGVDIYESDIVRAYAGEFWMQQDKLDTSNAGSSAVLTVVWDEHQCTYRCQGAGSWIPSIRKDGRLLFEVIGNIYENAELLK